MSKDDDDYEMTDTDLGVLSGTIGGFVEIAIPKEGDETTFTLDNKSYWHVKNMGSFPYAD